MNATILRLWKPVDSSWPEERQRSPLEVEEPREMSPEVVERPVSQEFQKSSPVSSKSSKKKKRTRRLTATLAA